ncbi:uncharacterized protein LOC109504120 isoform X2 [Harpegnathos saltator]|uniref:uncharacterized protein LOC109504120 isoform X2 n=1 Tax=Harpegnathos saltator TaxID=610380 RepID=UPI000DBEEB5E|nr:uncharacterized protein LOC109504120 isoform X2 [Harpegnathos saltator]
MFTHNNLRPMQAIRCKVVVFTSSSSHSSMNLATTWWQPLSAVHGSSGYYQRDSHRCGEGHDRRGRNQRRRRHETLEKRTSGVHFRYLDGKRSALR